MKIMNLLVTGPGMYRNARDHTAMWLEGLGGEQKFTCQSEHRALWQTVRQT